MKALILGLSKITRVEANSLSVISFFKRNQAAKAGICSKSIRGKLMQRIRDRQSITGDARIAPKHNAPTEVEALGCLLRTAQRLEQMISLIDVRFSI